MSTLKEMMIPISEYTVVGKEATLYEALQALEDQREAQEISHAHRDVLVKDDAGEIIGKVTMSDIFMALEPNYKQLGESTASDILTSEYVTKLFKEFNLWATPLYDQCDAVVDVKIGDVMHTPAKSELLDVNEPIETAVHLYISGIHQPILITDNGKVVGVLRFGDLFEEVRTRIMACHL